MIQIIMNTCKPKYGPQVYYLFRITITIYLTSDTDIEQILMVHYKHTRPLKSKGNKKKKRDTQKCIIQVSRRRRVSPLWHSRVHITGERVTSTQVSIRA